MVTIERKMAIKKVNDYKYEIKIHDNAKLHKTDNKHWDENDTIGFKTWNKRINKYDLALRLLMLKGVLLIMKMLILPHKHFERKSYPNIRLSNN